ncbi:putative GTP pyrophosphokinase [Nocardioides marinisabuli]|uniref:Putative GTP pyrophosphokinase n=1 Tax=Nocardioides marinisabuli TaxID=419476 RepID=A0A7Y9EZ31_9ACTN|nr:GTP pyrophosphokinase family protein [Nocardioides marinisabuli]NYD56627.1 putative GTP pyrophosphokinase [Nocardioides marinisabuli]
MAYKFGLDEMMTKINILREELTLADRYCPIEHVSSRLKSLENIREKALRIDCPPTLEAVRDGIFDIAGIRIVCSFISDAYTVMEMVTGQPDVELVRARDYIAEPKSNGYRSLNLVVRIPVHLSDRVELVLVEVQIRTVAMDFWASLEHKIHYRYHRAVPPRLAGDLLDAAEMAGRLDEHMERLHAEVLAREGDAP